MKEPKTTSKRPTVRRFQENLRLTKPIVLLSSGVLFPVLLSTTVGILSIVFGQRSLDFILGVLAVSLTSAAIGFGVVVTVLLGRRARAARLQGDLLGNVSHELKTPLAAIRLYGQTIQSGVLDQDPARLRQCADSIVRETEWLSVLIERLLTWRSAARDRENYQFVAAPLGPVLTEVADRFARMVSPDTVTFTVQIDTTQPVLHDPSAIASVVLNLLTNAWKYSGEHKSIQLTARDQGAQVIILVQDNGIGIPTRELSRIFEAFHRVQSTTLRSSAGTGLGLAIANHMIDAHGGTISVSSKEGLGSLFSVTLPTAEAAPSEPRASASGVPSP
jgi:two-component system phosphate regulon sensor histidine kinase PhoR